MKPSQQIAEEMAHGLAVALTEENRCSIKIGDCDNPVSYQESIVTAQWLLKKLPLTQLIEVARAANRTELSNSECTCYSNPEGSCRFCNYFISLAKNLNALKQIGKAEWL